MDKCCCDKPTIKDCFVLKKDCMLIRPRIQLLFVSDLAKTAIHVEGSTSKYSADLLGQLELYKVFSDDCCCIQFLSCAC